MAAENLPLSERWLPFSAPLWMRRRVDLDLAIPAGILVLLAFFCFAGPLIFQIPGPNSGDLADAFKRPLSPGHFLGTTNLGNDMVSQILFGGRITLEVSFAAVALGYLVGGVIGVLAGFTGGAVDSIVMRLLDVILAFPGLVLVMVAVTFLGAGERNLILILAFGTVPAKARIARAVTLRFRQRDFIMASRLLGKPTGSVVLRHLVPNVVPSLMTFAILNMAIVMIIMASLSFLGLGLPPSVPNWGYLISQGQNYLVQDPWIFLVPSCFLFVTVLSLNMLSDNLRARFGA